MINSLVNTFQNYANSGYFGVTLLLISFLGGILASLTPCSLSMLPIIVGYVGGYSDEKPVKIFWQMLSFVTGMSVVFSTIGIICAVTGKVFVSFASVYFYSVIASILVIMGLNIIGLLEFNIPVLVKELPKSNSKNKLIFSFLVGVVFAFAGSPCSTPILASIMALATVSKNVTYSILMLFLFSLGQGVILILAGLFTSCLKKFKQFVFISNFILKFSGLLLAFSGVYIFYKIFSQFL